MNVRRFRHPISFACLGQWRGDEDHDGSHDGCPDNLLKHAHRASPIEETLSDTLFGVRDGT
jgi:hypothetical protein